MIYQKLRKSGNSYVVTIPMDEVESLHLEEGDLVGLTLVKGEIRPVLPDDLENLAERSWERNEKGYRYLKGR